MSIVGRAVVVIGLGLGSGGVRFDPAPETKVVRTLEFESESAFESWTVVWNGQEVPAEYLPELWIEEREQARATVHDAVIACADGRVRELSRSFERLAARNALTVALAEVVVEERDAEGACALEGCAVRFDADGAHLLRGDAPDELLEALALDLDFTALLAGAREGDHAWEAPAGALLPFGLPGGIAFEFDEVPEEQRVSAEDRLEHLEGTWQVRRQESRAEGGLEVFALEGELATWLERETNLDQVPIVDGEALETTTTRWLATGELVWDVARRTLHSLQVEARVTSTVVTVRVLEGIEGEATYEQTLHMAGRSHSRVTVDAP